MSLNKRMLTLSVISGLFLNFSMVQARVNWRGNAPITVTPIAEILGEVATEKGISTAVLSPDGSRIAWYETDAGTRICLYTLESQQSDCYSDDSEISSSDGLEWSPDSRYLALSEEFARYLFEPDIWVFDTASGELKNLTDDGVSGGGFFFKPDEKANALIDTLPTWDPVRAGQLYFFRTVAQNDVNLALYTLNVRTAEIELVNDFGGRFPLFSVYAINDDRARTLAGRAAVSSDGARLAFIVQGSQPDNPDDGVWLLNLAEDGETSQVFPLRSASIGLPSWQSEGSWALTGVAWLPDGVTLLVAVENMNSPATGGVNLLLVNTKTGDIAPLVNLTAVSTVSQFTQPDQTGYAPASFSPYMPLLIGNALVTRALKTGVQDSPWVLRRFSDLPKSNLSEVVYEFDSPAFMGMETMSVSHDGKVIMSGYLIDMSG